MFRRRAFSSSRIKASFPQSGWNHNDVASTRRIATVPMSLLAWSQGSSCKLDLTAKIDEIECQGWVVVSSVYNQNVWPRQLEKPNSREVSYRRLMIVEIPNRVQDGCCAGDS